MYELLYTMKEKKEDSKGDREGTEMKIERNTLWKASKLVYLLYKLTQKGRTAPVDVEETRIRIPTVGTLGVSFKHDDLTESLVEWIKGCKKEKIKDKTQYKVRREDIDGYCKRVMKDLLVSGLVYVPRQYEAVKTIQKEEKMYYQIVKSIQKGDNTVQDIIKSVENEINEKDDSNIVAQDIRLVMRNIECELTSDVKEELRVDKRELVRGIEKAYKEVVNE